MEEKPLDVSEPWGKVARVHAHLSQKFPPVTFGHHPEPAEVLKFSTFVRYIFNNINHLHIPVQEIKKKFVL